MELPEALKLRLKDLGYTEVMIRENIEKYSKQAEQYIALRLGNSYILSDIQKEILIDNYIQYQLFAVVELDSLVEDKRIFLEHIFDEIKQNIDKTRQNKIEDNKRSRGIMVF
ncbi:hypothetical protein [Caviibacter abscessus]|uniref:hypothetical protein n=1 Tax=Caviibacter abscessus TaxID=1766719 RepID=UPI000837F15B|nr:hypothetical protein [Caviibacter abscessus]